MIWLFVLIGLLVAFFFVILARKTQEESWYIGTGIFSLITLVLAGVLLGYPAVNGDGMARLQNFYDTNLANYQEIKGANAVTLSESVGSQSAIIDLNDYSDGKSRETTIPPREIILRQNVNTYNRTLLSMKYYRANVFTKCLVPQGIEDMKVIVLTK